MRIIWATRGRTWGFKFLLDGGFADPLKAYETVFSGQGSTGEMFTRVGDRVALRFLDPLGRKDRAGRVIPHEFVVFDSLADDIHTVDDGRKLVWPLVADEYARIWDLPQPTPLSGYPNLPN